MITVYLLTALTVTLFLAREIWEWHARKQRRRFFASRPAVGFSVWFERHYANSNVEPAAAKRVIEFLGEDVGVEPTCFYPSDRLRGALSIRPATLLFDDALVIFFEQLCDEETDTYGLPPFDYAAECHTVDDVIRCFSQRIAGLTPTGQGGSAAPTVNL